MQTTSDIVQKLWNLCSLLREDGVTYHPYVTELTYLSGAFRNKGGGWAGLDKTLDGKLEQVLGELTDHVWSPAA